MSNQGRGAAAAAGFGVAFVLAGTALLLQELDMFTLRWSFVLPLIVIAAGVAVVFSGLMGAHRSRRSGGSTQGGAGPQDMTAYLLSGGAVAPATVAPATAETATPRPVEKRS